MMMRVNEVTMTSSVGAIESTVSSSMICSAPTTSCGDFACPTPMLMFGMGIVGDDGPVGGVCANASDGSTNNAKNVRPPAMRTRPWRFHSSAGRLRSTFIGADASRR